MKTNTTATIKSTGLRVYIRHDMQPHASNDGWTVVSKQPHGLATFSVDPADLEIDGAPVVLNASRHEIKRLMSEAVNSGRAFAVERLGPAAYRVMAINTK